MKYALPILALLLAGCAGASVANEHQYVIDTSFRMMTVGQAHRDAEAHCAQYGKHAVVNDIGAAVWVFDCLAEETE